MSAQHKRLDWVDMAKGISIFLVVMMYAASSVGEDTGGVGAFHWAIAFATPFRMPEFFLISGLFLSQVIDRPWRAFADRRRQGNDGAPFGPPVDLRANPVSWHAVHHADHGAAGL